MTCKDCINFEWCKSQNSEKISYYDGLSCMENKCHGFKNKSHSLGKRSIGKTVFLTREEAEKALQEVKENE